MQNSSFERLFTGLKGCLLFITALSLLSSCGRDNTEDAGTSATWDQPEETAAVAVEALEVTRSGLIPVVQASGVVRGKNEVWVVAKAAGEITRLYPRLGQQLDKGDIILTLEDEVPALNAELARQQYESAELDFEALASSYDNGGISKSEYNRGKSRLLQTRTAYETAKEQLSNTVIRSPIAGFVAVLSSEITEGNYITPGSRVARIVDTSTLKIEFALGERQVSLLKVGMPALIDIDSQEFLNPVKGEVTAIGAGDNPETGSFPAEIVWKEPKGAVTLSGVRANVKIRIDEENPPVIIPSSAVVLRDNTQTVFIAENGKALKRSVVTGEELGGRIIVTEGIEPGDILIISALTVLGDDHKVEVTVIGKSGDWW